MTWLYRVLQKGLCASGGNQGSGNGGQTSGGSNDGAQAGKPAGDKAQGGKSANSLASTGDQTVATVAAIGGLGAAIAAIGVFLARFRRKEDWRERLTIAHVSQEGRGNRRGPHFTGAV